MDVAPKFTFSAVLPLIIKCIWSSLSLKRTEKRPGPLSSLSESGICNTLSFYRKLRPGLSNGIFLASHDFEYSLKVSHHS